MPKISKLSFKIKINDENIPLVELFIDNESIYEILNTPGLFLPIGFFEDDLPYLPPEKKYVKDFSRRIIGICDCGEYGCDNLNFKIQHQENKIIFSDFKDRSNSIPKSYKFTFDKKQYQETIDKILQTINEKYKKTPEKKVELSLLYLTTLIPALTLPLITSIIVNQYNLEFLTQKPNNILINYIDGLIIIAPIYLLLGICFYLLLTNLKSKKILIITIFSILITLTFIYSTFSGSIFENLTTPSSNIILKNLIC